MDIEAGLDILAGLNNEAVLAWTLRPVWTLRLVCTFRPFSSAEAPRESSEGSPLRKSSAGGNNVRRFRAEASTGYQTQYGCHLGGLVLSFRGLNTCIQLLSYNLAKNGFHDKL